MNPLVYGILGLLTFIGLVATQRFRSDPSETRSERFFMNVMNLIFGAIWPFTLGAFLFSVILILVVMPDEKELRSGL